MNPTRDHSSPGPPEQASPTGAWIAVNGRRRALPAGGRLSALLRELEIAPDARGVAVAVNDDLVPRAGWGDRTLATGDRVEVVRAVQGG